MMFSVRLRGGTLGDADLSGARCLKGFHQHGAAAEPAQVSLRALCRYPLVDQLDRAARQVTVAYAAIP